MALNINREVNYSQIKIKVYIKTAQSLIHIHFVLNTQTYSHTILLIKKVMKLRERRGHERDWSGKSVG